MSYYIKVESPQNLMYLGDIMLEHPEFVDGENLPEGYAKVETIVSGVPQDYEVYVRDAGFEDGPKLEDGVWVLKLSPKRIPEDDILELVLREESEARERLNERREKLTNNLSDGVQK